LKGRVLRKGKRTTVLTDTKVVATFEEVVKRRLILPREGRNEKKRGREFSNRLRANGWPYLPRERGEVKLLLKGEKKEELILSTFYSSNTWWK